MLKRWLALVLVLVLGVPQGAIAADAADTDLANGVRQAQEGDFENAVVTLDGVVRRLSGQSSRSKDLARAYVYLSVAYHGLGQEQTAKSKFVEALRIDRDMTLSSREFPPRILEFFERTRREANLTAAAPAPVATPRPAVLSSPEPERKKRSKTVPILIGAALLGGVGVAVAAGGGGSSPNPAPTPQGGPLTFRLSWTTPDDLDLFVVEPSGFEISFLTPNSATGGAFGGDVVCSAGTETTAWPGSAPRGTYVFYVANQPSCDAARSVSYTLTVAQGNSVVFSRTGTLGPATASERFSFVN